MNKFNLFVDEHAKNVTTTLVNLIDVQVKNRKLAESMNYSLQAGGKRIRPILVLAAAQTFGEKDLTKFYEIAGSIELIHTYSLIHDDLPEMDNDDLRRGKATNHIKFGVGQAVLAGDALLTLAFELISSNKNIADDVKVRLINILSKSAGPKGMVSGQWLDISNENISLDLAQLTRLHKEKTGALLQAAIQMGMSLGSFSDSDYNNMMTYAENIGLAFQVKDDILDVISDESQLGKETHKDGEHGKNTFPSLIGLEESKEYLNNLIESAKENLEMINADTTLFFEFLKYFYLGE